jgi:putative hemolysin
MNGLMVTFIAISFVALLSSAFFSTAEVAIFSLRRKMLKTLQEKKDPRSDAIQEVLRRPRRFVITIWIGNVLSNSVFALAVTLLWYRFYSHENMVGWWIPMVSVILLLLFFGELIPKAIATRAGTFIALNIVGLLRNAERQIRPLSVILDKLSQQWVNRIVPPTMRPVHGLTEDEYLTMLDVSTKQGTLRSSERRLIERTLQLADRNLRELMTPRNDMNCLDVELDFEEMKVKAAQLRHRRLPLYSDSPDSIVGILNVRRFLLEAEADIIACVEPPAFVPETMTALELLKAFMRGPQRMAMVVDEFGGVEGLVTLEDIVEEVFGEIYDEYDDASEDWTEISPKVFSIRGTAHLPKLSRWLGVDLEAEGIDTLGGWITDRLGAIPKEGDSVSLDGLTFQVNRMQRWRVGSVILKDERFKT